MKATKTIGTLIAVCFGFLCLSSYAVAEENALASNMDTNADYVSNIQETTTDLQEGQFSENEGIGKVTAFTAIVALQHPGVWHRQPLRSSPAWA